MTSFRNNSPLSYDRHLLEALARALGLRLVVLFGSWARGRPAPGPASDVDVAVLGCAQRSWDCYRKLARAFDLVDLDLVRLEDADPLFRHEIMRDGVLLYGDPDLFADYRAYAYRDFVDSADLRALEDTLFRKKMARLGRELHGSH